MATEEAMGGASLLTKGIRSQGSRPRAMALKERHAGSPWDCTVGLGVPGLSQRGLSPFLRFPSQWPAIWRVPPLLCVLSAFLNNSFSEQMLSSLLPSGLSAQTADCLLLSFQSWEGEKHANHVIFLFLLLQRAVGAEGPFFSSASPHVGTQHR